MQRLLITLFFLVLTLVTFPYFIQSQGPEEIGDNTITWHSFEWLPSDEFGGLSNPRAIMFFSPNIEGVGALKGFQISLEIRGNFIYESAFNLLLWRRPDLEKKILSLHAAGRTRARVLEDAEVAVDDNMLGYADFRVIERHAEPEDIEIGGFIGYDFFKSMNTILVIDHPASRFACLDKLPDKWEEKAHFAAMGSSLSFTGLRLRTNGRRLNLSFDGMPTPALVLYRNRDFRRMASDNSVADSLKYYLPQSHNHIMLEGKRPKQDIFFGPYKLKSHNVYLMPEREHRLGDDDGLISQAFFEDYILILDFKTNRLGIVPPSVANE